MKLAKAVMMRTIQMVMGAANDVFPMTIPELLYAMTRARMTTVSVMMEVRARLRRFAVTAVIVQTVGSACRSIRPALNVETDSLKCPRSVTMVIPTTVMAAQQIAPEKPMVKGSVVMVV